MSDAPKVLDLALIEQLVKDGAWVDQRMVAELLRRARQLERVEGFLREHGSALLDGAAESQRAWAHRLNPARERHYQATENALAALLRDLGVDGGDGG